MIPRRKQQGFTIVELLIVIVVIAILAAIVIVSYNGIQQKARETAAQQEASTAARKLQTYRAMNSDAIPDTLSEAGIANNANTTYQYWKNPDVSFGTFCVTATTAGVTSHSASTGKTVSGPCPGHTGNASKKLNCPAGFITVPGNALFDTDAFCVMKYEAKDSGGAAVSVPAGLPWHSTTFNTAKSAAAAACSGCHLVTPNEWLTLAHNVMSVDSNWSGGSVGNGFISMGLNDNVPASALAATSNDADGLYGTSGGDASAHRQKRTLTLTNGEVIWDLAGNAWEFVDYTFSGGQPGLSSDATDVYKDWTNAGVLRGNFARYFPGYANPQAVGWGSTQGLGKMITDSNQPNERIVYMGGGYTTGYVNGGIFTLRLNTGPTSTSVTSGFRAAR